MKKRGFATGKWNGPGGKVEPGETVVQAMIRECQEEISVTPTTFERMADVTFEEVHESERKRMHTHVFIASAWEGVPTESEEMAPKWFLIDALPHTEMWDDDQYWLPQVLSGQKIIASFSYGNDWQLLTKEVTEVDAL